MNKYFLHDGQNQLGPFDKSELNEKKITAETPIWFEGLTDWTTAGEVSDLKDLFVLIPPPFRKAEKAEAILVTNEKIESEKINQKQKEDTKVLKTTKKKFKLGLLHYVIVGSILLIGVVLFIIYNKTQEKITEAENQTAEIQQNLEQEKQRLAEEQEKSEQQRLEQQKNEQERQRILAEENTPEKLRERLLQKEQSSPIEYLSGSGTLEPNITRQPDLFHHTETDGYLLKGYVKNSASMAVYKDVVIVVKYFTKTMTLIDSEEITISEYFNPHSPTNFSYKLYPPNGYEKWNFEIINASPVPQNMQFRR